MISQTAEYALRAIVQLAYQGGKPCTSKEIAEATRVPAGYLAKVMQSLSRAQLVNSQRGLHGGFTLARPATDMTLWDVVQAVDPIQRITECPMGIKGHGLNLCPVHQRLDDAIAHVQQAFQSSTVAEMIADPSGRKPLCETHTADQVVSLKIK